MRNWIIISNLLLLIAVSIFKVMEYFGIIDNETNMFIYNYLIREVILLIVFVNLIFSFFTDKAKKTTLTISVLTLTIIIFIFYTLHNISSSGSI